MYIWNEFVSFLVYNEIYKEELRSHKKISFQHIAFYRIFSSKSCFRYVNKLHKGPSSKFVYNDMVHNDVW